MVISHKYRYVFIQTAKTASSTIASALCHHYDGEEILHKHASMEEFLEQARVEEKQFFSFAGVRNPLDVAVSRFELRKTGETNENSYHERQTRFIQDSSGDFGDYFREFIVADDSGNQNPAIVPTDWNSKSFQAIDYIYRYENLSEEFSTILKKIGVNQVRDLRVRNATEGKQHFLSYYDRVTLELAYQKFFHYLDHWGYEIPKKIRQECLARQQV